MRPVDAPFVGRSEELETLKEVLRQAVEERSCRLGTIVGPPGIGKSRLARELVALAGEARILVGRCLPYGEGITFWALGEIVKGQTGILESDSPEQAAAKVETAVERVIIEGPHTPDMKGKASTAEVGAAVAEAVRAQSKVPA